MLYVFIAGKDDGVSFAEQLAGRRRGDGLEHPAGAVQPVHLRPHLVARVCDPRGARLRRRAGGRLPQHPQVQQGPRLRLRAGVRPRDRQEIRGGGGRHLIRLPDDRHQRHPADPAHRRLHLRARRQQRGVRGHRGQGDRGARPQGRRHRGAGAGRLQPRLRGRAHPQGRVLGGDGRPEDRWAASSPRSPTRSRTARSRSSVPRSTSWNRARPCPFAVHVEVSGRKMQKDFEPILERQVHSFFNEAEGVLHMGQRDTVWMRISNKAKEAGFKFEHLGKIIHARYHADFGTVVDKVQVTIYTKQEDVERIIERARAGLSRARRAPRQPDGRERRHLLLLHPLPELRADARVRHHAGASGPVRFVQLARRQGRLRDQPDRRQPAGAQGRDRRRRPRPVERRQRVRRGTFAGRRWRPSTPTP